ncbi:hypothetical protein PIB30_053800 [Stylosanthes scabra]|uniref:Uncharacterized protein n=1 Tax=Stylosanthes scabra TaxID=79078 RepID=A0ABU6YG17_9FABA|nr:hypothetical protein [Stylosanthes scabra]
MRMDKKPKKSPTQRRPRARGLKMARPRPPFLNMEVSVGGAPARPRLHAHATPFRNGQYKARRGWRARAATAKRQGFARERVLNEVNMEDFSMFQRPRIVALEDENPGTYGTALIYPLDRLVSVASWVTRLLILGLASSVDARVSPERVSP